MIVSCDSIARTACPASWQDGECQLNERCRCSRVMVWHRSEAMELPVCADPAHLTCLVHLHSCSQTDTCLSPRHANRQWYSVEALYVASAAKEARPSELQGCFAYCTLRLAIAPPPKQYHYIKSCTATHATLPSISIYMHSSYMRLKNPEKIDPWW